MRDEPATSKWTAAHWAGIGLVFLLIAIFSLRQIANYDTGFHLRTGQYILEGHAPPATDPFSFTMQDHAYTDTSWGYDVLVALVHKALGGPGLVVLHALLVLVTFGLVLAAIRTRPADPTTTVLALLLGGVSSETRFEVRPEVLSFALLALVLVLLHRHAEGQRSPLWALPVIHLVWTNMHGLFVLGWIAIACFAAGLWIRQKTPDKRLLAWGAASVAVGVLNPYGLRGLLFPLELATRLSGQNVFATSIEEFVSPFVLNIAASTPFYPWQAILCFRVLFVLSLLALVGLWRQRRLAQIFLAAAFSFLAYRMVRNLPVFVVACLPGIVHGLSFDAIAAVFGLAPRVRARAAQIAVAVAGVTAIVLCAQVFNDAYYVDNRRVDRFGWNWNRLGLPIDAARFADRAGLRGPMLNHLNFGGYLMWARPEPVFIDGRLEVVGERFYTEYRKALSSAADLEGCVSRYGIQWMIFPYQWEPDLLGRVSSDPRWSLAYRDHLAAIFVRTGADSVARVDPDLLEELRSPPGTFISGGTYPRTASNGGGDLPDGTRADQVLRTLPGLGGPPRPSRIERWMSGLWSRKSYPLEEFNRGVFHLTRGELDRARWYFVSAIERSGGAFFENYGNLGSELLKEQRYEDADLCYRVVLAERPKDLIAREVTSAIDRARVPR